MTVKSNNMTTIAGHALNAFVQTPRTYEVGDSLVELQKEMKRLSGSITECIRQCNLFDLKQVLLKGNIVNTKKYIRLIL